MQLDSKLAREIGEALIDAANNVEKTGVSFAVESNDALKIAYTLPHVRAVEDALIQVIPVL